MCAQGEEMLLSGYLLAIPKPALGTRAGSAGMLPEPWCKQGPTTLPGTSQEAVDAEGGFIMGVSVPQGPRAHGQSIPHSSWSEVTGREQVKLLQT